MRKARLTVALATCLLVGCGPVAPANSAATHFELPNGLHVILRPVRGAQQAAVVTLFAVGGDHDPPGVSGMAHFVEHLYVTAAAGDAPPRTTEEFVRAYPLGWNAQTGDDYTVFATIVEPTELEAEIRQHAQRMGDLQIAQNDLRRELPRIEQELHNMFGGIPALAAMNLARERVRPTPLDGRKGGQIESLKKVSLDQLQSRWQKYYKPAGATLVVAGDFDPASVRPLIETAFTSLPPGEDPPPAPPSPPTEATAGNQAVTVKPVQPTLGSSAALAFRAPLPAAHDYPAFLYVVVRLLSESQSAGFPPEPTEPSLRYSFLDDPHVLFVVAALKEGETADKVAARLRDFVDTAVATPWNAQERMLAKQRLAFFLDTMPMPDHVVAQNVYGAAFGVGRRHQMKLDGQTLARQLDRIKPADVERMARTYLAKDRGAVVVVSSGQ